MNLDKIRTIGILGDRDFGKTSIMFSLARSYKGKREIVFYAYPNEQALQDKINKSVRIIHTLTELELLTEAVVFMDELQKHIKFYQKRVADEFLEILSTIAHNNVSLIFSTPMSQFISKTLDCFIDGFVYVKISDLATLKNGSKAKRTLQDFSSKRISKRTVRLEKGEYLQIVDGMEETNGIIKFSNPNIKKDWNSKC